MTAVASTSHDKLELPVGAVKAGDWILTGVLNNKVEVLQVVYGLPVDLYLADGTRRSFFSADHRIAVWRSL